MEYEDVPAYNAPSGPSAETESVMAAVGLLASWAVAIAALILL
jgi:hypothetical protein